MDKITFVYRSSELRLTEAKVLYLEQLFAVSRMIYNRLTAQVQSLSDIKATSWNPSFDDCEALVLKMMNESEGIIYDMMIPSLTKSVISAWLSEWADFREKRSRRPVFRTSRVDQTLWLLSADLFHKKGDEVYVLDERFDLTRSEVSFNHKATAAAVRRITGRYYVTILQEKVTKTVHHTQDDVMTRWGDRILELEQKISEMSSACQDFATFQIRRQPMTLQLHRLRKIALHRIVRTCDEKARLQSEQTEAYDEVEVFEEVKPAIPLYH